MSPAAAVEPRTIPFFNYQGAFTAREDEYLAVVRDVIRRGAFIQQRDLADFERRLAEYLGVRHAFGVGNATDGLIMAWRAAGLRPGDEVILPSHTMVATAAAVHFAGGTPVLADCGPDHLIDADSVERLVSGRTRAICPVQLNGRTADMDRLQAIADRHGLFIIEDAAQGLGSSFRGRKAGTFGVAAAFSFYPAKILGCFGDGGAVVTDDDAVAERLLLLRDHGRGHDGLVHSWGLNSRLDNLQAAVLDLQFRDYHRIVDRRRAIAARYEAHLGDVPELVLPPGPDADPDHFDVFQNYELEADRRDALRDHLKARGVGTLIQWGGRAVHQNPDLGFVGPLPNTDRLFERCLMLPMNTMVSDADVDYVAAAVREFYGRR
jgi:dTDP-4-amino-4,6-dideoxygalactose transaminase